jgi:hypothetical protein
VLVGTGPLERTLREQAGRLGVADRVVFAGYRRDVPALLAASDALVLASEREGLPRSVLEAMASARPVIGTDTRGIADAVGDHAGWIVPKRDARALAAAIDAAARDRAEAARRGRAARSRAEAEFALPRIIDAYEPPDRPYVDFEPRAGTGYGVSEAPRGLLYHRYRLDEAGIILDAKIVPPTSQNQLAIEDDLRGVVQRYAELGDDDLRHVCEQAIRNFDPCISCATHFLTLEVDRR